MSTQYARPFTRRRFLTGLPVAGTVGLLELRARLAEAVQLLVEEQIDAFMVFPPLVQELQARQIGHVVVNSSFGCGKPQKAPTEHAIRTGAAFARSEACETAGDRLARSECPKDGTVPYKAVERCVRPRYAVEDAA
jgi:hypothetical protein